MQLYFLFGCLGNTRVITQTALQTFQEEMGKAMKDPYKVTGITHPLFQALYAWNVCGIPIQIAIEYYSITSLSSLHCSA